MQAQNQPPKTELQYLSGHGCDDMVEWDFMCTDGRNSGKWGKIGVPSCWELQGYGTFQYGMRFYGIAFPEGIAKEKGLYKYEFTIPAEWRGKQVELVFEASMTDTEAKINGRKAVGKHQGGFYRFVADVTDRVNFGKKNILEVTVSKDSENGSVNLAERRADYWNFGGLFRPVFLRAKPAVNIRHFAIDAKADGTFKANCYTNIASPGASVRTVLLDMKGKKVAEGVTSLKAGSDWANVDLKVNSPALWTAETPNLYTAQFTLLDKEGKALHQESEKFGFRTIEVRESDGLYINGVRVNIRGVNRHSFRPETGRTLSKAKNIEDVLLIKSMNMNSVRLSHYPADPDFLYVCDSLGLYVMNELTGWHGKYDTAIGVPLVKSLVERDVNHPSVIWWSNGNEKGWNTELDGEFHKYDPQLRPVLHPQGNFSGFETMHYRSYGESQNYMRLPQIFMPTEFLHGLYDGGHGAGLWDYWEMMRKHPRCIGGFLWVLADEGVKRVDMDGFIDNQGNFGADGIVGPHHEKEGSYYTVKQIWCPVQIMNTRIDADFDGTLYLENRYDFLNLNTCRFVWKRVKFPEYNEKGDMKVLKQGEVKGGNIAPHSAGTLAVPVVKDDADALMITVIDVYGNELFTWSYPLHNQKGTAVLASQGAKPTYKETEQSLTVSANGRTFTFCKEDGQLKGVNIGNRTINLANGPRFIGARRGDRSLDQFYNHDDKDARSKERVYEAFPEAAVFTGLDVKEDDNNLVVTANYKLGNMDKAQWTIAPDGTVTLDYLYNFSGVVDMMGICFDYPEDKVISKRWLGDGPYRVWQNRLHGPQYGLWENDYNDPIPGETFTYPEFKGYFAHVTWMNIKTQEGTICIQNETPDSYIGVYQPRDGRDRQLYTFPESGISVLNVIPPVRNKVNTTDLCGPSSQPKWVDGQQKGRIVLRFE
ncbi:MULTISPECIES: glycoside hydrolase family 2 TIM barrel-domain containing protein [unclassified Bacteroides]|uniref:glycoside hydrolase family 2 protein n=1 Tax=unclassified Bacteroides TaxID=2646097 RepID=UPI000E8D9464|nr:MULTISPECIES: glycoside hydrolase family 2 TIM barrel-domain containing protein [unclassified Bacteroides]RGN50949.1 beta-galactosidase [Bacteroides sp. OM05-12]RHR82290.1 beta-galactosidase [Bacteroides sp. AF16-49]